MSLAEVLTQAVPSAKALTVITGLAVGAFAGGVGFVLGFGDYADLPLEVSELQAQMIVAETTIRRLENGLSMAHDERHQILCLVRLTATEGTGLTPLEVQERCP
jgi:hypothetical protein